MASQRKVGQIEEIDKLLAEVREMLTLTHDASEMNELVVLQMLLSVTKELHSLHDVRDVITKVLDSALAFVNGERGFIMLLDEESIPRFKMGRNRDGEYLTADDFSPSSSVIDHVLETRRSLIIPDAQSDEYLSKRESVQNMILRSVNCAPLMIKQQVIGLLYVDSRDEPVMTFSLKASLNFLTSLADQAAVAIRNAQKFETYG
ncbi:MAG: GAF domain-containing protein [Anaerolineales bacterium]